jgi:hypothetical protein
MQKSAPGFEQVVLSSKNAGETMGAMLKGRWCMDFMLGTCTKSTLRMY